MPSRDKAYLSAQRRRWYHRHKSEQAQRVKRNRNAARVRSRKFIDAYLTEHPCVDCGEKDSVVLEFDHVRGKKRFDVSRAVSDGLSSKRLIEEIEKCEVRCANCHRRVTAKRRTASVPGDTPAS